MPCLPGVAFVVHARDHGRCGSLHVLGQRFRPASTKASAVKNPSASDPSVRISPPAHPRSGASRCPGISRNRPRRIRRRRGGSQAILASPSYRLADDDIDFLHRDDDARRPPAARLPKAELLLAEHGIEHTIVVFGSTRICEPGAARRKVERAARAAGGRPRRPGAARQRLAVAERILAKSRYYDVAREFGRLVGEAERRAGRTTAS